MGSSPNSCSIFFLRKRGREDREEEKERGREGYKKRGLIFLCFFVTERGREGYKKRGLLFSFYWYDVLYF